MSKRLILVLAFAFVASMCFAAYAEVQNVKVSGDILASGILRDHFGLSYTTKGDKSVLKQSFLMTQTRVRVDADLTDNVMTTVRLINERLWNGQRDVSTSSTNSTNIDLDLAYVTLKEFLYSPLSLTIGRQDIKFGNGLVIGKSAAYTGTTAIPTDLSERSAFDALRATLNYDPLVVDLLYAKVKQTNSADKDTIDLAGINATYALNKKTNIEGYYFIKEDKTNSDTIGYRNGPDKVNTVGTMISSSPIENLTASAEAAYQFGRSNSNALTTAPKEKQHDAWAFQAMADYTLAKVKTTPKIGASYTYLSGEKNPSINTRNGGWDPMFYSQALNNITYALLPFTDLSVLNLKASCKPLEDVTLAANYGYYNTAKKSTGTFTSPGSYDGGTSYLTGGYTGKPHLGDAVDVTATYDYTEDVQLGLTAGWFAPSSGLTTDEKTANQVIGSLKVTF